MAERSVLDITGGSTQHCHKAIWKRALKTMNDTRGRLADLRMDMEIGKHC